MLRTMSASLNSFADLLAPFPEERFFAEFHDQRPLHIPAETPGKFADVMNWDMLNQILNMTAIWSPESFQLVLDRVPVPVAAYCREAIDRTNRTSLQPDAEKVRALLKQGASLVANDIDTLTPGLANAANILERTLGGKTQSNLYCSWRERPAFATHFDTHEVFALHVEGEKTWRIYEGRVDRPIAHPAYKSLDEDFHDAHKGAVLMEVTLRPGDLLYIPRGQYHDALASSAGTVHVAFGVTHVIGMDFINILLAHSVSNPAFRTNFPLPHAGEDALRRHVEHLVEELAATARTKAVMEDIHRFRDSFAYPRGGYALPNLADPDGGFTVRDGLSITSHEGRPSVETSKGTLVVPQQFVPMVEWILSRQAFGAEELRAAFPKTSSEQLQQMLAHLASAGILISH